MEAAAEPAVTAYQAFNDAANNALRHPYGKDDKIPADANFAQFAYDPFRSQFRAYVWGLALQGAEYRGVAAQPHVTVTSIDVSAKPWPTATLSDCQTGDSNWRLFNAKTGAMQPRATQRVSPPYRSTITMILYQKHWGVSAIKLDSSQTCTP